MNKLIFLLTGLMCITSCGFPSQGTQGPKGDPGAPAPSNISLEGYYLLPNGGFIDIYQDAQGAYTIRSARLVMANADGSSSVSPIVSTVATAPIAGKLYITNSQTYVALTHNTKQDIGNAILVGAFQTELMVYKISGNLTVRLIVNNLTGVAFDHTVTQQ